MDQLFIYTQTFQQRLRVIEHIIIIYISYIRRRYLQFVNQWSIISWIKESKKKQTNILCKPLTSEKCVARIFQTNRDNIIYLCAPTNRKQCAYTYTIWKYFYSRVRELQKKNANNFLWSIHEYNKRIPVCRIQSYINILKSCILQNNNDELQCVQCCTHLQKYNTKSLYVQKHPLHRK